MFFWDLTKPIDYNNEYFHPTIDARLISGLITKGDLTSLKSIKDEEIVRVQIFTPNDILERFCTEAAKHGHLHILQWLRNSVNSPRELQPRRLDAIRVVRLSFPWNELTCQAAAENGHLKVLQWLRSQTPPCPWNDLTCEAAAKNGHFEVLQWVRSQVPPDGKDPYGRPGGKDPYGRPCPWNKHTFRNAIKFQDIPMMQWILSHGGHDFLDTSIDTPINMGRGAQLHHYDAICWLQAFSVRFRDVYCKQWIEAIDAHLNLPDVLILLIKRYI